MGFMVNFMLSNKINHMFKNLTFTALFTLLSLAVFGQLPMNTIEVTINESFELPVKEYVYQVSNTDIDSKGPFDFDFGDYEDEFEEEEEVLSMPKTISWMKEELEGADFKCTVRPHAFYDVDPGQGLEDAEEFDREVIEIRVKTLDELNRLSKFVLQLDDAYGELTNIEFEDVSNSHEALYPEMMKKAKKKATIIANTARKKVGDVIQITEGNDGINLYGDELGSYMETMMELSNKLWKKSIPTHKMMKLTLKYVFELK